MSEGSINKVMNALFTESRIVFWYDESAKLREQFDELELDGVEKCLVMNNEFEIKYQIINEPQQKLLLYFPNGEPALTDNWLIDLQLAYRVFNSDRESMFLQEVGLDYHFKGLVKDHIAFFESKERRSKLGELISSEDNDREILYKMMAVMFGVEYPTLEAFIQEYAGDFADGNDRYEKALERYNLKELFWSDISRKFHYEAEEPTIYDFLLDVFARNFRPLAQNKSSKDSRILIALWKDAISHQDTFQSISDRASKDLNVEGVLAKQNMDDILGDDIFQAIDFRIIHELIQLLNQEAIDLDKLLNTIKQRENKYWYFRFKPFYACLRHAGEMIHRVRKVESLHFDTIEEGAGEYAKNLFSIDYHYRKFIFNYRLTQNSVLGALYDKVDKVYSNDWLLAGGDQWQKTVDSNDWPIKSKHSQLSFFNMHVRPKIAKGQRLFVVISDALRYENGYELYKQLQAEKRYEAKMDYMISGLPSYTQLGMAALLPHEQLSIVKKDCTVIADGISSAGTSGRAKILEEKSGVRAIAVVAEEFMNLNAITEGRAFIKKFDLIYIYHNQIDKEGDDKTSEVKVFEAVDSELKFLHKLLKQIANVNGNNILITADHGYLYQNEVIHESDYAVADVKGDIWKQGRRFVIGKGLTANNSVKSYNGSELGLTSDADILIPKSINRLRLSGAGTRFVHGGASLQEAIVPLIEVTKKRLDTTRNVDVEIIKSTDRITTNILAVTFIQKGLVTDKVLPRTIRALIRASDGTQLSDVFTFRFDIETGAERERAVKHRFQLSAAASGKYKGQSVRLILEEPVAKSSKWNIYAEHNYQLNISFMNDFDDF